MRIAIVCSYYPWPPSIGGIETIVRNVSIELAKRGHEVHVITTPFDVTTMKQVSGYGTEERDGIIIHKLKPGRLRVGYARSLKGLKETVKEIKPEILHSHNLHPHLFQLAKWKDELKYKLVSELHHPAIELDFLVQKLLMPFASSMLTRTSKTIDAFVAHTSLEEKWLSSKGINRDKIKIVKFPAIPSSLVEYQINCKSDGDVLFLGRVVYRKGLHALIKALSEVKKELSGVKATIAGPSESHYLTKLMSLVKQLGLRGNIFFRGSIPEEEKYKVIKFHKILVLPPSRSIPPVYSLRLKP